LYGRDVPRFDPTPTDDPVAAGLLTDYFTSRALGFTTHPGGYRVAPPDPASFRPPRGVFLVVRDDEGRAVGCGGIRRIDDVDDLDAGAGAGSDAGATFEVKHLWLNESARGHGWSRLIMDELESRARGLGAGRLVLDTNESLTAAQHLYRTSGYEEIAAYNDNPNATHWFGKRLARKAAR
jgi:GNAT superfamily N-acetyltransferase